MKKLPRWLLIGLAVLTVAAATTTISLVVKMIAALKADAVAIHLAGRQGMLNERYAKDVLLVSAGHDADPKETRTEFFRALELLQYGGDFHDRGTGEVIEIRPAPTGNLRDQLAQQRVLMAEELRLATLFLSFSAGDPRQLLLRSAFLDQSARLQEALEDTVRLIDSHAVARLSAAFVWAVACGIFLLLISVGLVWLTRRSATLDLRLVQEVQERTQVVEQRNMVVETVVDGIITLNSSGMIQSFNSAAEKIFGYERREVLGKNVKLLMPEPYQARHDGYLAEYLKTGKAGIIGLGREVEGRRSDGSTFPLDLAVSEMKNPTGSLFVGILRDITQRKRAHEELRAAKTAAEAAAHAKSRFLANISHELRTPLNSVIGFSNILLENKKGNLLEKDITYLERVRDNGKHLLALINGVLDISKIEAGRMELALASVSLGELIPDTLAQLAPLVEERGLRLSAELPERLAPVVADAFRLKQILINLVNNAIKFTKEGGVTVRVSTSGASQLPRTIEVIDTGIGIPKDKMERIFDAFQQADTSTTREYGGSGLGLAISRAICGMMQFGLEVESEVGKGSTFRIVIPAQATKETLPVEVGGTHLASTAARARPSEEVAVPPAASRPVLVLDADEDARMLLCEQLREVGALPVPVASGDEAFRKAREQRPELILLELITPRLDGWEVLRRLKADTELCDIPIMVVSIMVSGYRSPLLGLLDHVPRPLEQKTFCAAVRRNLPEKGAGRLLIVDHNEESRTAMSQWLADWEVEIQTAGDAHEAFRSIDQTAPELIILDMVLPMMDGLTFLGFLRNRPRFAELPVVTLSPRDFSVRDHRELQKRTSAILRSTEVPEKELGRLLRKILSRRE